MSETETSRKLKEVGEKAVQSIVEKLEKSNVAFKTSIQEGKPFKQINSYADQENMDIIVMSTHGRTGLDRLLIGSVTEKVVRSSEKPVLTVKNK
jgi:nucleotide-binding universal stress UspA family protein